MRYLKFNVLDELKKVARGAKTEADPAVLVQLIAGDYLKLLKSQSLTSN